MNESNSKPEKERRYDPELLKKGLHCDLDQYEMLKRCSDKKDMTEWNEYHKSHLNEKIWLQGADLIHANLQGARLIKANLFRANLATASLVGTKLWEANLECSNLDMSNLGNTSLQRANLQDAFIPLANLGGADLIGANLKNVHLVGTNLQNAILREANLGGANFETAIVDGATLIWKCKVNRHSTNRRGTNFTGVGLGNIRIDPGTKQLLECNIRRANWKDWYKKHWLLRWPICWFWWISNYGISTKRIIFTFLGLALVFALLYRLFPDFVMVYGKVGDIRGLWHALYFSVVTMTTLGFGDIAANPDSWGGQTLLMLQVILGYVLLGALVTRFAVLFTAGGPAGKFADEKEDKEK